MIMKIFKELTLFCLLLIQLLYQCIEGSAVQMVSGNIDSILNNNELVMINFYAEWCRFSQILSPVYDDVANKIKEEYPEEGKVVLAKVDCDRENGIAARYHVSKYPTLKLFRYGSPTKREYRGQRSVDALVGYLRGQLQNPLVIHSTLDDLDTLDRKKRHVIGYFDSEESGDFQSFHKVASSMRDDCSFHAISGPVTDQERIAGNKITFRAPGQDASNDLTYSGPVADFNLLRQWIHDKCVPLVREITFDNAEELTEEGLAFMILFHHPDDLETPEKYRRQVAIELLNEKNSINFLTADGLKFSHPLHHIGKTTDNLPVIAIDSFRHMYVWNHDPKTDIEKPGLLKQFVADLHSGKLHREFHQGPDPVQPPSTTPKPQDPTDSSSPDVTKHVPKDADEDQREPSTDNKRRQTSPPESLFRKLGPSRTRYTILRDEL